MNRFIVGLTSVPQPIKSTDFAIFVPGTNWFNVTVAKLIVSTINNVKTMAGGHTVPERQAILLAAVVIFHTFCIENANKLTIIT